MNWSIEKMMQDKPVVIADLQRLLADGNRLVVRDLSGSESILFESTDRKDLDELWESLTLETPVGWRHCMCIGNPLLQVYRAGHPLVALTNHHGSSIRCSLWSSDVRVLDTEKWLSWFDRRGIAGPRRQVEKERAQQAQWTKDYDRWLSAMPRVLREVWSLSFNPFDRVDLIPLRAALETNIAEERDRILSLLEWFGCGEGSWSGYPAYEVAAEELLLDYATTSLVAALESMALTPAQKEGAARLFAGSLAKHRPPDLNCLPDSLKQMLWDHTKNTQDGDKLSRATRAFDTGVNRLKKG
jgi:hypothetical protein